MVATEAGTPELGWFLKSLIEEGRAIVGTGPLAEDSDRTLAALTQLNEFASTELGLVPPAFSSEAALWGARLVYHLCQFTVCRDLGETQLQQVCRRPCPTPRRPAVDWSVDLTLRHLSRIHQLAQQLSHADPLIQQIREIAVAWPLSSVGIPKLTGFQIDSFIEHPALRRLYADRILATGDDSRLGDPQVDQLLQADLGLHRQLAPGMAAKLFPEPV
ncbi:MAG: hypothetical protein QM813_25005 [Verrucomicrobiota bacterium]